MDYTLEKHLENIRLLENLIKASKTENEEEMFCIVNNMADFVQENFQYSFINNYNLVANLLVDTIYYCNSKEYNLIYF